MKLKSSLVGSVIICAFRSRDDLFELLPFSVKDSKKINKKQEKKFINILRAIKIQIILIKLLLEKERY